MIYYKKKIQQDVGATAVEYGILSALIAVVTILGLQATGTNLGTTYCTIANQLSQAVGAGATASGCSATSSNSSGSGSGSPAGSGSGSGSDSPTSESGSSPINATISYTLGDQANELSNLINMMTPYNVQSMTNIFDSDGNPITTPKGYAKYLGITDDTYTKLSDVYINHINPDTGQSVFTTVINSNRNPVTTTDQKPFNEVKQEAEAEMTTSGNHPVYIPNLSDVKFTDVKGQEYSYEMDATANYDNATGSHTSPTTPHDQMWRVTGEPHGTTVDLQLFAPTGK